MNRFARLRFERGLTQRQVADGAHISRATVIRLEKARHPKPTAVVLSALADFYKIPVSDLFPSEQSDSRAAA